MIVVIRISGQVEISPQAKEAMHRMKMRRKFVAVLLEETKDNMTKIKDLRNYVAYGKISEEMLKNLLEKRAESLTGKKIDASKHHADIGKKDYEKIGIKPFFRLHPPIGGIDQKHHFGVGKGILGDNGDKINELLRRML